MKNLSILGLLSFLFYFGCNQEVDLTSQSTPPDLSSLIKQWITLSDNGGLSIEETYTKIKNNVDGSRGWNINFDKTFSNGIRVYGDLNCPPNAYTGRVDVSLTISGEYTVTDFTPTPFTFDTPVEFTVVYEGLDLTGVNPADVDFYYIATDGSMQKAVYDYLQVDIANGKLLVLDAKMPHFSRYGFVN